MSAAPSDRPRKFLENLSAIFLVLVLVTVFLQVVFRSALDLTVPWTEEAARYLAIWMAFLGCAVCVASEAHLRVTYLIQKLPPVPRRLVDILTYLVMMVFDLAIVLGAIELMRLNWDQQATTLPVSVGVLYLALAVSMSASLLFLARGIVRAASEILTPRRPWKS